MKVILLAVFLSALPLFAADNLLKNGGFEAENRETPGQPYDWGVFTESGVPGPSALSKDASHEGNNSYKLLFEGKLDRFLGVSQNVPIKPGQKLKLTCYILNLTLQNTTYGQLALEWKNASGQEISRDLGEGMTIKNTGTKDWTRFELVSTAPEKTESVTATISLTPAGSTDGSILVDDVRLEPIQ